MDFFQKVKSIQDNSGVCNEKDCRTDTDRGRSCKKWIGIKYERKRKSNTIQLLNNETNKT